MIHTFLWLWNMVSDQTWYKLVDSKQDFNHTKYERPLKSVRQKATVKVFVKSENMSITSLKYVQKCKIVACLLSTWLT